MSAETTDRDYLGLAWRLCSPAAKDVCPVDDAPDGVTRCAACGNDVAVIDKEGLCAECWA